MTSRFDISHDAPAAYEALYAVTNLLSAGTLPKLLKHLIDLRVSQLNGCRFCIDLHIDWARRDGENDQRLAAVSEWQTSPLFTAAEKAALDWAEALTERRVHGLDAQHAELGRHFSRAGIAELTMMVGVINAWNRVGIACHPEAH